MHIEETAASFPLSNQTLLADRTGKSAYISRAVVLSIGVSQAVGTCVIIANIVNSIWNLCKLAISSISLKVNESKIQTIKGRITRLQQEGTPQKQREEQQKALEKFENLLSFDQAHREEAIGALKENAHGFVVALLGMIPFFGLLAGGAYAHTIEAKDPSISSVEKGAERVSHYLLGRFPGLEYLGRKAFFPLSSSFIARHFKISEETTESSPSTRKIPISVERGDGKQHHIICHEMLSSKPQEAKTMILFSGNSMIGTDMQAAAQIYKEKGWNTIMVTMGGYPGSDSAIDTTEATTIQDVNAVLRYLENERRVQEIGVHGFSIGCSLAMHATRLSDKVKVAILDKPFASVQKVAVTSVRNALGQKVRQFHLLPTAVIRGLIAPSFPIGCLVGGVRDKEGNPYRTDGFDNEAKAKTFDGKLLCIEGVADHMMSYDWDETYQCFNKNFADDIHAAHHSSMSRKTVLKVSFSGHDLIDNQVLAQLV